jgi:hypothetical protein
LCFLGIDRFWDGLKIQSPLKIKLCSAVWLKKDEEESSSFVIFVPVGNHKLTFRSQTHFQYASSLISITQVIETRTKRNRSLERVKKKSEKERTLTQIHSIQID